MRKIIVGARIENYLGFPTGISGQDLAERAYAQAQKFGADIMIAKSAAELTCQQKAHGVRLEGGATISARTVIIATGARYRKPPLAKLGRFEGVGVYYNATFMEEAQLGDGDEVFRHDADCRSRIQRCRIRWQSAPRFLEPGSLAASPIHDPTWAHVTAHAVIETLSVSMARARARGWRSAGASRR
jgi:FAD binding domain